MSADPHSTIDLQPPRTSVAGLPSLTAVDSRVDLLRQKQPVPVVPGYEMLGEIGRGGMGVVYQARDARLSRMVAIKMILGEELASTERLLRFLVEAETAAQVKHPHVVQVYEAGEHDGKLYIVTEYVTGGTLHRKLAGKAMPPKQAAELTVKLAEAVAALHAQGVLHRDLKPANVLLDDQGEPKVTDFGLAKRLGDSDAKITKSGLIVGTPEYMAPEQAQGRKDVGTSADLYALGVIFYECLTGSVPFRGNSPLEAIMQLLHTEAVPPSRVTPGIPRDLEVICMKCLSKEPAHRYPTAVALAEDLRRFLQDQPVLARRITSTERMWRWCQRNPLAASLAATACVALVVGMAGTTWGWRRALAAEAEARIAAMTAIQAQKDAESKQKQTEAVASLIESLFSEIDPNLEKPTDLSLREQLLTQLNAAVLKMEHQYDGDLVLKSRMQHRLGRTLYSLGETKKAEELVQQAAAIQIKELGKQDNLTLNTLNVLALCYRDNGKLDDALKLFEQVYRARCETDGEEHEYTLIVLQNLAVCQVQAGQTAEAIKRLEKLYQVHIKAQGENNPTAMVVASNLATAYRQVGQLSKALPILEMVHQHYVSHFGAEHLKTMTCLSSLALTYRGLGRTKDAIPLQEQVLKVRQAKLGNDHPDTLKAMSNLAIAYQAMARSAEATKLMETCKETSVRKLGSEHPDTLLAINNLASQYVLTGKLSEAQPYLEPMLATFARVLGPDRSLTMQHAHNTAMFFRSMGRHADSLQLLQKLAEQKSRLLGKDHPDTLTTLLSLSQSFILVGNMDEAAKRSEEVRDLTLKKFGADHPTTLDMQDNLAGSYRGVKRWDEAIALLKMVLAKREKVLGPQHPQSIGTRQKIASTYQACERWNDALTAWKSYQETLQAQPTKNVRELANVQANQAMCQLGLAKPAEAIALLHPSLDYKQKQEPEAWGTYYTQAQLGRAYLLQKEYAKAEPLLLAAIDGMKRIESKTPTKLGIYGATQRNEVVNYLVQLYQATNQAEKVKQWQKTTQKDK